MRQVFVVDKPWNSCQRDNGICLLEGRHPCQSRPIFDPHLDGWHHRLFGVQYEDADEGHYLFCNLFGSLERGRATCCDYLHLESGWIWGGWPSRTGVGGRALGDGR